LYILTEILSEVSVRAFNISNPILELAVKTIWFAIFAFVFIPKILKLPKGDTRIRGFAQAIGLGSFSPIGLLLFLTLTCYVIFAVSQVIGAVLYHSVNVSAFNLDFSRHSLLHSGSVVAAVFEEIVMRGIIVTLLLQHTSSKRAIFISAGIFAGLHLFNMLNPGVNQVWVFGQVIWAFFLGAFYAYIFIRTFSLYPVIILHYLINAMIGVWFYGLDRQDTVSVLYGIPFLGAIPAVLAIIWTRFVLSRVKSSYEAVIEECSQ
jgi:membrane protease YdiL (CAAX protease family)